MKRRGAAAWTALLFLLLGGMTSCGRRQAPAAEPVPLAEGTPLPTSDEWQCVGEAGHLMLSVNTAEGFLAVEDTQGVRWNSVPDGYQDDGLAQGITKVAMESLLQVSYVDKFGNVKSLNAKTASVKKQGLACEAIPNGVRMTFSFEKEGFVIPVEFTLTEDGMEVSVPAGHIRETHADFQILSVSLLPYFGAASTQTDGWLLLPDGSGALAEWNRPDAVPGDYRQYLYGRDPAILQMEQESMDQVARLPVFGLKNGDHAMMGIVTDGAGRAAINASVGGKRSSFSHIYAEFIVRDSELVTVERKGQTVRVTESDPSPDAVYRVRYLFLNGEEADYVWMARHFGAWLFSDAPKELRRPTLTLEIIGGVTVQDHVAGFPVERVAPLTTYKQASELVNSLREWGVTAPAVLFTAWREGGMEVSASSSVRPEGSLGGRTAFSRMAEAMRAQNISLYLEADIVNLTSGSFGFSKTSDVIQSLRKGPATQYRYAIRSLQAVTTDPAFLLRVDKVNEAAARWAGCTSDYAVTGWAPSSAGHLLYSDFEAGGVRRAAAEHEMTAALDTLKQAAGKQLLSAPNAYAVPYADLVTDTPLTTSGFYIETDILPFYQLALRDYTALTTPDLNRMSDTRSGLLRALESGIGLKFRFTHTTDSRVAESDFRDWNGPSFETGGEEAAALWSEASEVLETVVGRRILHHRRITDTVRQTVFEGGITVYVNYGETAYRDGSLTVEAGSFTVT